MTELLLLARVGDQRIAFDAKMVDAVVDIDAVVPVPMAPPSVRGLTAIRSRVVTVVDCGRAVGAASLADDGRAVTLSIDGHGYAIRVDAVDDVVPCPWQSAAAFAPMLGGWAEVAAGAVDLGDGFAIVIDARRLVSCGSLA
jgi:purine-binding chemotaxis protein CheW